MHDLLPLVDAAAAEGVAAVLVRAVDVHGFGAGQYDQATVVTVDGRRAGAVLRGAADATVAAALPTVLEAGVGTTVGFLLGDPDAPGAGLSCGGRARLVVEPLSAVEGGLWTALRTGRPIVVGVVVDHPNLAPHTVVVADGRLLGSTGDASLDTGLRTAADELAADPRTTRRRVELDRGTLFLDLVHPRTRIVAFGSGEVVDALRDVCASLGWLFDVVPADGSDSGPAALTAVRSLGGADAVVVVTHDPVVGPEVLAAALAGDAFFVGALGSRHTQRRRADRLAELGLPATTIARIHGPVGLDLGGRAPAETALAICAQVLAVRSGRDPIGLAGREGPING